MKMKMAIVLVALLVVSLSGCQLMDTLFFNADAVKASDLEDFSGSTPTTKDEALNSVIYGVGSVTASASSSVAELASTQTLPAALRAFAAISGNETAMTRAIAATRTISPSTAFDDFITDVDSTGTASLDVTITDEDFDTDNVILVNGTIEANLEGFTDTSTSATADFNADLTAEVEGFTGTFFNGAIASTKIKGDSAITLTSDGPQTFDGYLAFALNAGISLDEDEAYGIKGGKYIFAFKYTTDYSVDITSDDPTSEIEAELVLKVYDANDKLAVEFTYTADDIAAIVSTY